MMKPVFHRTLLVVAMLSLALVSCTTIPEARDYQSTDIPIMGIDQIAEARFVAYLTSRNNKLPQGLMVELYRAYDAAARAEGVKLSIALAQMLHETNFMLFTGTVRPEQNNFAGIGTLDAATPGNYFPDYKTGALAHVQHLKAYASTEALKTPLVDPRFKYVKRGIAPNLAGLTGRWASDPNYAERLRSHLERMAAY